MNKVTKALLAAGVILLAACGSTSSSTSSSAASSAATAAADPAVAALESADASSVKFSYVDPSKSTHSMTDWQSPADAATGTDIITAAQEVFSKISLNPQEDEPSEENLVYSVQPAAGTTVYLYSSREVKCVAPGSRNLYTVEDVDNAYAKLLDQIDAATQAQASAAE